MFEKCESSIRKKEVLASFSISAGFLAKTELVFVFIQENAFLRGFILKPRETAWVLLKNNTRDF